MTTVFGFHNKLLRVNLTKGTCAVEALDPEAARLFLGGAGYSIHILYKELPAKTDPLGPENKLVFAPGPLSDNRVPGGGSLMVCFKSPLTQAWGQSRCGGNIGPDIRRAGFDFIVVEGASTKPVYLEVLNGTAALRDATPLVGKDVYEKCAWMENTLAGHKGRSSSLCIGIGGENLVRFAAIMHGDRAAGRAGGGAVMGSKNFLGLVVQGSASAPCADPQAFMQSIREGMAVVKAHATCEGLKRFGTVGDLPSTDEEGDWPTKNWRSNSWGEGATLLESYQVNNFLGGHACYAGCPIGCGRTVHVPEGAFATPRHGGAEYESISAFTAFTLNKNMDAAVHATYLCNKLGIDTISAGAMVAFAMDCAELGLLSPKDCDGLPLDWGNAESMVALLHKIARREGVGDLLAEGVQKAAARLGKKAEVLAVHVKGLEGPAHDPRSGKALGISYATGNRGMCHVQPLEGMCFDRGKMDWGMQPYGVRDPETVHRWDETGKGKDVAILQNGLNLPDIMGTCKFLSYAGMTVELWAKILSALTGWNIDDKELLHISERTITLQRMFNIREGFTRKDDRLPERALTVPEFTRYKDEPNCVIHNLDALLDEFYTTRSWDKTTGIPTPEKLESLNLTAYIEK